MLIAMLVHAYYLRDARVRRYGELLARRGHEVDVLCLRERDEPAYETHNGVHIYRINLSRRRGGKLAYVREYFSSVTKLFVQLNRLYFSGRHYHLIHVHNMPNFLVFSTLVQKWQGAKVILDVHDPMPEVFQSKYRLRPNHWMTRCLVLEELISRRIATETITANHEFKDILINRGYPKEKITVIMNAPDEKFVQTRLNRKSHSSASDRFHILYIGTVAERYGVQFALRAVAQIKDQGAIPGLRFSIIPKLYDEGEDLHRLLGQVDMLGLADNFSLLEPESHDRMPDLLASADLVIYTPLPDVHMDVAMSLKIPEAIAVGCPVVASNLSVLRRYFGEDDLFLFEPGDVDACVSQILEVYRDPRRAGERMACARARFAQFGWSKHEPIYLDLLGRLVHGVKP